MKFATRNNWKMFCAQLTPRDKTILAWRTGLISQNAAEVRLSCDSDQLHRYKRALRTKMEEEPGYVRMLEFGTVSLFAMLLDGITKHQLALCTGWSAGMRDSEMVAVQKGLTDNFYSGNE